MEFIETSLADVVLVKPKIFHDGRGFFFESYQSRLFSEAGISTDFVQDNHTGSKKGVLRGLHYQIQQPQGKLVRVIAGKVFDVAVDLRRGSPTFGQWTGVYLSAESKDQLWVPIGFAHGFYTCSDWAEVFYKVTNFYAPEWERTLIWNDPQIGIEWPLLNGEPPRLSERDARGVLLADAETYA